MLVNHAPLHTSQYSRKPRLVSPLLSVKIKILNQKQCLCFSHVDSHRRHAVWCCMSAAVTLIIRGLCRAKTEGKRGDRKHRREGRSEFLLPTISHVAQLPFKHHKQASGVMSRSGCGVVGGEGGWRGGRWAERESWAQTQQQQEPTWAV